MGASLAVAIRKKKIAKKILGFSRSSETIKKALRLGYIDEGVSSISAKSADLIIICTPLGTYESIGRVLKKFPNKKAIITDIGSVKEKPSEIIRNFLFVPAHPIAGSEKSGIDAALQNLYEGKKVIITPIKTTSTVATKKVESFWKDIGCNIEKLSPAKHDEIYAAVSHLPQLMIFAYAEMLGRNKHKGKAEFFRLAASDKAMWRDIFSVNKKNISKCIAKIKKANVNADSIPQWISNALIKVTPKSYLKYAGTGFKSATSMAGKSTKKLSTKDLFNALNNVWKQVK